MYAIISKLQIKSKTDETIFNKKILEILNDQLELWFTLSNILVLKLLVNYITKYLNKIINSLIYCSSKACNKINSYCNPSI